MKLVDELRRLYGNSGSIAVSESEYMATILLQEAKPLTRAQQCVPELVHHPAVNRDIYHLAS